MLLRQRPRTTATPARTEHASSTTLFDGRGTFLVTIEGTLDHAGEVLVGNSVREAAAEATVMLMIDCTGCDFVDSSGLRALVQAQQTTAARRVRFRLRPSEQLRELLAMTGLLDLVDPTTPVHVVDDEEPGTTQLENRWPTNDPEEGVVKRVFRW